MGFGDASGHTEVASGAKRRSGPPYDSAGEKRAQVGTAQFFIFNF